MKSMLTSVSNFSVKLNFLLYIIEGHDICIKFLVLSRSKNLSISKLVAIAVIKK